MARLATHLHRTQHAVTAIAALIMATGLAGCAGSAETRPLELESGPGAESTVDGLVRAKGSSFKDVWVKPDAYVASYTALLIGDVDVAYKRKPKSHRYDATGSNFPLDESQLERLRKLLRTSLAERIEESETWTLADGPGTHVLLLEPSLIDLVVKVPTNAAPSTSVYTTSTAEVTLLLELHDSLTGEILARIADRREARQPGTGRSELYWSNPVSNQQAVKKVFNRWARILMARLDTAHRLEPTAPLEDAGGSTTPPRAATD